MANITLTISRRFIFCLLFLFFALFVFHSSFGQIFTACRFLFVFRKLVLVMEFKAGDYASCSRRARIVQGYLKTVQQYLGGHIFTDKLALRPPVERAQPLLKLV